VYIYTCTVLYCINMYFTVLCINVLYCTVYICFTGLHLITLDSETMHQNFILWNKSTTTATCLHNRVHNKLMFTLLWTQTGCISGTWSQYWGQQQNCAHFIQYYVQRSTQCVKCKMQCTVQYVHCTVYSVYSAQYSIEYNVYRVWFSVHKMIYK